MDILEERLRRREFLRRAGLTAAGVAAAPILAACNPSKKAPTSTQSLGTFDADKLTANLNFTSVNYNPPKVRGYVSEYMKAYPNVDVQYDVVSSDLIHDKLLTIFTGGGDVPNLTYVGDESFRQFIDAGWIQPLDAFPGATQDEADFFPHTKNALTWQGKLYGLPYYSSIYVYGYNTEVLGKVGITDAPANLNDVKEMSLEVKKAGVVDRPLLHAFKLSNADGDFDWWSLLYASGGDMFDADLNPTFADSGSAAEQLLAWLVDAMNTWEILDPASLQTGVDDVYLIMGSAKKAFAGLMDLFLFYAVTSSDVSAPNTTKLALFPGLQPENQGTVGWTRAYSIPTKAKDVEASWTLLQFMGGSAMAGEHKGTYFAARDWFLTDALGYGYTPLDNDPQMAAAAKKWVDLSLLSQQRATAKSRSNILVPWYFEWTNTLQAVVQEALNKQVTPQQAMKDLASKTDELRKTLGD